MPITKNEIVMKIFVQNVGLTPRQELLDLLDEKIGKLDRFSDRILEARVTLRVEKADDRNNKTVEVKLAIPGDDIFVKKTGETFEEVVQRTSETLQRAIKEWKGKQRVKS
jgi:putative sigma-54 modulation protein